MAVLNAEIRVEETMAKHQRPVVCMICLGENDHANQRVLMQIREPRLDDTPYRGYLELPQGKVKRNETVGQAAARELKEETGLSIRRFLVGNEMKYVTESDTSQLSVLHPLVCVVDAIQNHLGLAVVVEVEGQIRSTRDARSHSWLTIVEIKELMSAGQIFPLNVPMLEAFIAAI